MSSIHPPGTDLKKQIKVQKPVWQNAKSGHFLILQMPHFC